MDPLYTTIAKDESLRSKTEDLICLYKAHYLSILINLNLLSHHFS